MYKISKKLALGLLISLSWSHIEFAPAEGFDNINENAFDTSDKNPKEIAALKNEARRRLGLKEKYDSAEQEIEATTKAHERELRKYKKSSNYLFTGNKPLDDARNLLLDDIAQRETIRKATITAARKEEAAKEEAAKEANMITDIQELTPEEILNTTITQKFAKYITKEQMLKFTVDDLNKLLSAPWAKDLSPDALLARRERIQSLTGDEILTLDLSYFKDLKPEQFTPDLIAKLSPDQMKELTTDQMKELTSEQLKAIFTRPDLVQALATDPAKVQAIDPKALAKVIKGDLTSNLKNKFSKNNLPQSFVDAFTSDQAKAIMDMHEGSKGRLFDSNDLKYFFSDAQIKMLKIKADQANGTTTEDQTQARILIRKLLDNPKLLDTNIDLTPEESAERQATLSKFRSLMTGLPTAKEREQVANDFTETINEEESKWFGLKKLTKTQQQLLETLKKELKSFVKDFVQPVFNDDEWALSLQNGKTGHYAIAVIDMGKVQPDQPLKNEYERLKKDGTLTEYKDGYISYEKFAEEYTKWFVAKRIELNESFETQTDKFNTDIVTAIETALRTKINDGLQDGSVRIQNLDPSYIRYVDVSKLSEQQISALTDKQISALTDKQIAALSDKQIAGLSDKQIAALSDKQIAKLTNDQKKILERMISNKSTSKFIPQLVEILTNSKSYYIKSKATSVITDQLENNTENFPAEYIQYVNIEDITPSTISTLNADQITNISDDQYNSMNKAQQEALAKNLSKLSDDELRNILRKSESSKIREAIYTINPKLGTVAVRPEQKPTSIIIDPRIDQAISQQQDLLQKLNSKNERQLVPKIVESARQTTEDISTALDKISTQRKENIRKLNEYLTKQGLPELSENPTNDEIRNAVRKLSLKYHPDRNPSDSTIMGRINQIRDLLIDELPQQVAELSDRLQTEQKLLTDVQKNKGITLTPQQFTAFSGVILTIGNIVKMYTDLLPIKPQSTSPLSQESSGMLKKASNPLVPGQRFSVPTGKNLPGIRQIPGSPITSKR